MVSDGQISAEETILDVLDSISSTEHLNIFVCTNPDAIQDARDIDRMVQAGKNPGRLAGVPVSIKDNICTHVMPTTCASRMLEGYVSPYEATVVERLRREGAVIVGKTNMDEFAMGITTEYSAYGPTLNPRDTKCVPGGSSGGSAAAVAAGISPISLGSDTGGSVRNPASFCGVAGFKPTYGMVSRYGLVSYSNSIEQIGPLAATIPDIILAMGVVAGPDPHDMTTMQDGAIQGMHDTHQTLEGKRIGIIQQMAPDNMDGTVRRALDHAIHACESLGAVCEYISIDMIRYAVAAYYTIVSTEAASNLARYDNIRYGYALDQKGYEFHRYITKSRERFGPEVRRRIIAGGFVSSEGYAGRYFQKALGVKGRLTDQVDDAFKKYDYMMGPTVPVPPFGLGEMLDDPMEMYRLDINTVTANLTGKPAVSIPYGESSVGIQIMGDSYQDGQLLGAACALEAAA